MALTSALVDRARAIRPQAATAGRVAGSTVFVPVESAWFNAFLQMPQGTRSPDGSDGRRRVVTVPTLIFDVVDDENEEVAITVADRLEIDSERLGRAIWQPTADPQPLATLTEVLGWQVTVKRVVDHEFSPVRS